MIFEYSMDSLAQLKLRSISDKIVEIIMNEPYEILIENDNQHIYQKIIEKYLYRVFINAHKNPILIKTVYRTSKIYKYQ